jgi:hypothetical protein
MLAERHQPTPLEEGVTAQPDQQHTQCGKEYQNCANCERHRKLSLVNDLLGLTHQLTHREQAGANDVHFLLRAQLAGLLFPVGLSDWFGASLPNLQ